MLLYKERNDFTMVFKKRVVTVLSTIILMLILSIICSACYPTGERESLNNNILGNTVELKRELIPSNYYDNHNPDKVNENISICCSERKLYIPDEINFCKITTKKNTCNEPEKIKDIFLNGQIDLETAEADNGTTYYYTSDNGANVTITGDSICYIAENTPYAYNYRTLFAGDNTTCHPNLDMFYRSTEIEGIDKNYAINLACEKLDAIGIDYYSKPKVICLDAEGVATALEYFDKIYGVAKPLEGRKDIHDFSKEDEAYLIIFNHSFEDMPISYEMYYNNDFSFEACYAYAVVNKNGLVYLDSSLGYTPTKTEKLTKLYNIDVIYNVLKNKYGNGMMKRNYLLEEIHLEYICINEKPEMIDGIIFEPYYICYFTTNQDKMSGESTDDRLYYVVYMINALTGEVLDTSHSGDLV